MRVLFVTQLDEIHSSIVLQELLKSKHKVVGVVTSKTLIHKKNILQSLLDIIRRSGFRYFLLRAFEGIYIKFYSFFKAIRIDRFKGYSPYKVNGLLKKYKIKHIPVKNINSKHAILKIKKLKPNIIVCCVFNQIFKKELLSLPREGCINIHRSLLPKYRGVSPTFWALVNNEKTSGITLHEMIEKIDTGDILAQKREEIIENDTVNTLSFRLMRKAGKLLINLLDRIENKKSIKRIKMKKIGKYYTWPTKAAVKKFLRNKRKVF